MQVTERTVYRPSGRCEAARMPGALLVLAATSSGLAAIYFGQLLSTFYISGMSVFVPVVVVASAASAAVKRGHWRNPALAGVLASACGLAGYLGYFHIDQCIRWGVSWTAIGRLPEYVTFRMETDSWQRASKGALLRPQQPAAGVQPHRPLANAKFRSWNWFNFAFESLALALVPVTTAVAAARAPYSERRRRWCSREQLALAPQHVTALKQALANGTVGQWVDSRPQKVQPHLPHGKVLFWYTPAQQNREPDPDVYVAFEKTRPLLLLPEEAAALVTLMPGLQDLAGSTLRQLAAEADEADDPTSARVWPVPAPYAGQAETPRNRMLNRLLVRALMLLPGAIVALLLPGAIYLLALSGIDNNRVMMGAVVVYVLIVGFALVAFVRWWYRPGNMVPLTQAIRFDLRQLRKAVAARPPGLVAADDPRAVFCEMLPRRLWGTGKAEPGEYDNGLLLIDRVKGGIAFEGDLDRYWIPAASVLHCDVELHPSSSATTAGFWAVVLKARLGSGSWEFPLFPLANIAGRNPWERAMTLLRQIEEICGRDFSQPTEAPPREREPVVVG